MGMKQIPYGKSVSTESVLRNFSVDFFNVLGREANHPSIPIITDEIDDVLPVDVFRDIYWARESFSKAPWTVEGVNREAAAYEQFYAAETQCARVNSDLCCHLVPSVAPSGVLGRARRLVHQVLGEFSWDQAYPHFSFGPGATTSLRRRTATHANKWELGAHITGQCLPLHLAFLRYTGVRPSSDLVVVQGNTVTTVPKNWKTDRVIAIEPDWNMFYQRGIGGMIRSRLRRRLQLLTPTAQARHKRLAQIGSETRQFATLDLKAASDTVTLGLCEALLPRSWFLAMLHCRSPQGSIGGETITYEKISSMGNGFTFELETLLFWSLARAISNDGLVSVYGDDIIVSTAMAEGVIDALVSSGFELNLDKSHWEVANPFRESCGGHFYRGHDVTPPYFRNFPGKGITNHTLANAMLRGAGRDLPAGFHDSRWFALWSALLDRCNFFGPESLGDSVAHVPFDFPKSKKRSRRRFSSKLHRLEVRGYAFIPEGSIRADHQGGLLASLYGHRVTQESIWNPRGRYRLAWLPADCWTGPMAWV